MYKKLIVTCMAVAAFAAFAMSASASAASPLLTNASGTAVPVGTSIKATNIGVTKLIAPGVTVECSNDVLTGKLTANPNNGNPVEGTVETASFKGTEAEENCKSGLGRVEPTLSLPSFGLPFCISFRLFVFQIRGGSCGSATRKIGFTLHVHTIIGVISCQFERTVATGPITGTYNTGADLVGEIKSGANSKFVGTSGGLCPTEATLEMKFGFTEDPSGTLTMD